MGRKDLHCSGATFFPVAPLLLRAAFLVIASAAFAQPALADCTKAGARTTCSGTSAVANGPVAEAGAGETIVNNGAASVTGTAPYALFGGGGGTTLSNAGSVTTLANSVDALEVLGSEHTILNGGVVLTQGVSSDGLRAIGDRNELTNTGEVRTGGANARGMVAEGAGNSLLNQGRIITQSLGGEGMNAAGNGNTLTNHGQIQTSGPVGNGIRSFGSHNTVLNAGTVVTSGLEARGVKVDFGTGARVVNRGSIRTSGIDAFGVWIASTPGQSNSVLNEASGEIVAERSLALKFDAGDEQIENFGLLAAGAGRMAVDLGHGDDRLLIGATSRIQGFVEAGGGRDTFAIGGDADSALDAREIGASKKYRNFEDYEKVGGSTWTLTGANSGAMPWAVREGVLMIAGNLSGATMTVHAGATLGGSGTVGHIDARSDSTLSPGTNGIGVLHVTGNVLIANGTIYRIDLNPGLQSDRIAAQGSATVQGGTVHVKALPGDYKPGSRWLILSAARGVAGQFDGVTTNLAFFQPQLTKDAGNIYLQLPRLVRELPGNRPVIDPYLPVTDDELPRVLDLTSGEAIVSATGVIVTHDDLFRAAVLCRLRCSTSGLPVFAAYGDALADYAADAPRRRTAGAMPVPAFRTGPDLAVWAKAIGSLGSTEATAATASVERSTGGVVVGVDGGVGTPYRIGFAAGYFSTNLDVASLSSFGQVESVHIGAYGSAALGAFTLRGGVAYAHHEVDLSRSIAFRGFSGSTSSTSSADSVQVFGELGTTIPLNDTVALEPFIGLAHVHVSHRGILEEGSAVAVAGDVHSLDATFATLGTRLTATWLTSAGAVTFKGLLGWRHAFGDVEPKASFSYVSGSSPFIISGAPIDRNSLVAEAGLNWAVSKKATLSVAYAGTFGSRDREHTLRGGLTIRF